MKSQIYISLLSLIYVQSVVCAANELNQNNDRSLIRLIAQDKNIQFAGGIAAGFMVPKLIESRGGNGIKYATALQWESGDIVNSTIHTTASFFTNTMHASKSDTDYRKIIEKTTSTLRISAFTAILTNMFKTFRAIPNCTTGRLIQDQGYMVFGGAIGAAASSYAYKLYMEHHMLPALRTRLSSDEYNALPLIYQNPSTLTHILTPLAIEGSSYFALHETLLPRIAFGDNLKITMISAIESVNLNYTKALWDESKKPTIIDLLTPTASLMSSAVPIPTPVRRGMAFGQICYLLYRLFGERKEIFASSRFIKAAALISGSTLLAHMGYLAYKQRQVINPADEIQHMPDPA